ncbi:SDR family NAD(P)-dependent oxidoreductase [Paenibacillus sp. An7]|uniref:SDR family NAD(P)-dependent oxidoreductase n=1 Tax=Paenibacillus sp. An7 TaxID=2689577 RepID=UPI00191771E8|nr:SDR family NAD(P)-dependent oxidoreductase [Paenibacillus sp. An7]
MRKVIVSGAAGFLGSYLVKQLIQQGEEVIGIDNLSSGLMSNLSEVMNHSSFKFLLADVSDKEAITDLYQEKVKEIYHLASQASPKFYQANPFETMKVNTQGTFNLLELARDKEAKFLYTSTSEAYGDPEVHPQPESYRGNVNTWGPRACYDEAKRLGEVICYEFYERYGVAVKVARIFNTYSAGLRNDDGRVISNFVTQALAGEDITVYGDGSQTRSFCYVDDNIRGLQLMMGRNEATGEIINIGNPKEYSILEVANIIKELTHSNSKIIFCPLPKDDPKVRRPDIGKAREILNWEPFVTLHDGLNLTIQTYQENLNSILN